MLSMEQLMHDVYESVPSCLHGLEEVGGPTTKVLCRMQFAAASKQVQTCTGCSLKPG